jgi:hypothetical protein
VKALHREEPPCVDAREPVDHRDDGAAGAAREGDGHPVVVGEEEVPAVVREPGDDAVGEEVPGHREGEAEREAGAEGAVGRHAREGTHSERAG